MENDWIEKSLHPALRLECDGIRLNYLPVEVSAGPPIVSIEPATVRFEVECIIPHSSGELAYTANDLYFDTKVFLEIAHRLKAVFEGDAEEASCGPWSSELVLTIRRDPKFRMSVSIYEWHPDDAPDTVASASRAIWNPDLVFRWIDEFKSFSEHLDNWVLMNRPEPGGRVW